MDNPSVCVFSLDKIGIRCTGVHLTFVCIFVLCVGEGTFLLCARFYFAHSGHFKWCWEVASCFCELVRYAWAYLCFVSKLAGASSLANGSCSLISPRLRLLSLVFFPAISSPAERSFTLCVYHRVVRGGRSSSVK